MTHPVYYDDGYQTSLETRITSVNDRAIVLDATIFYPTGGGQPGDIGTITTDGRRIEVTDTRRDRQTGSILHEIASDEQDLQPGQVVSMELDWTRRHAHMRMHSAMHLLGSLIPVPVTGGQVGAAKSRLDFDVGKHQLDKEALTEGINQLIAVGHEITIGEITEAELDNNPGLVRTMSVQPPRGSGTIRMVSIEDVDYQPCGGTHVRNTDEIGVIRVSKIENKGKRNRRVHLIFDA